MEAHVRNVVRSCFYQLQQLRSIRRSLPTYDVIGSTLIHDICSSISSSSSSSSSSSRRSANPGCCIHRHLSLLLQRRSVCCLFDFNFGLERCRLSGRRCWQIQTRHAGVHTGPSRRVSLAPSATANTVQDSNLCIWLCPWALSSLLQQLMQGLGRFSCAWNVPNVTHHNFEVDYQP